MKPGTRPGIDLTVKPPSGQIKPGESLTLSWSSEGADSVLLAQGPPDLIRNAGIDWAGLQRKGKPVPMRGDVTVSPRASAVYTLVARNQHGRHARSAYVDVIRPGHANPKPTVWCQQWDQLPPDFRRRFEEGVRRWATCMGRDAAVTLAAEDRVVYTDERTAIEWHISCSDCAQMSESGTSVVLVADATQDSGTRVSHGVGWGMEPLACSLEMSGRRDVADLSPGQYRWTVTADAIWGNAAGASAHVACIPRPHIEGANADRAADIERAVKRIARDLLNGCIRDSSDLDDDVPAFRDGWLNRLGVWVRLLAEIENLQLITFQCEDVPEYTGDAPPGSWTNGTNTIHLRWAPGSGPNFPYVILHELIHKAGFNDGITGHYSGAEVEEQAHQVTAACY